MSFFIGTIDLTSGKVQYVNAGHPEAFVVRPEGERTRVVQRLTSTSGSVGHISLIGEEVEVGLIELEPGDLLFVYTDGASEMLEPEGGSKSDGVDRLATQVEAAGPLDPHSLLSKIRGFLDAEAGGADFEDDVTLLALKYLGPQRS